MGRVPGFIKRAPRIDLDRSAVLIDSDGEQQQVTVLDVSSGGFKLKVSSLPRIGDHVRLRVDGSARSKRRFVGPSARRPAAFSSLQWIILHCPERRSSRGVLAMGNDRQDEQRDGQDRRSDEDRRDGSDRRSSERDNKRRQGDRRGPDRRS